VLRGRSIDGGRQRSDGAAARVRAQGGYGLGEEGARVRAAFIGRRGNAWACGLEVKTAKAARGRAGLELESGAVGEKGLTGGPRLSA
jgi:hypothetical protein